VSDRCDWVPVVRLQRTLQGQSVADRGLPARYIGSCQGRAEAAGSRSVRSVCSPTGNNGQPNGRCERTARDRAQLAKHRHRKKNPAAVRPPATDSFPSTGCLLRSPPYRSTRLRRPGSPGPGRLTSLTPAIFLFSANYHDAGCNASDSSPGPPALAALLVSLPDCQEITTSPNLRPPGPRVLPSFPSRP
jgi:hypothetical protein